MYISNLRSQITYLFVKFGCSICIFLKSGNLIFRSTDISKCFKRELTVYTWVVKVINVIVFILACALNGNIMYRLHQCLVDTNR